MQDELPNLNEAADPKRNWAALVGGCIVPLICWGSVLFFVVYFFFTFEPLDFDQ